MRRAVRAVEVLTRESRRLTGWLRRHGATPTGRLVAGSATVGLALAALLVALVGPWDAGQRAAERDSAVAGDLARVEADPDGADGADDADEGEAEEVAEAGTLPTAGLVLSPLDPGDTGRQPMPSEAALADALEPVLDDAALGPGATGSVVDVATGTPLFADGAASAMTPASTIKLVTAAVALDSLGPDHRLQTPVVWDQERGLLTLVGGGDTTLRSDDLRALAERTAEALRAAGTDRVRLGYDISLYPEERHPIGVNENIALITPLMVDTGRLDDSESGPAPRATDPAPDAADAFAGYLRDAGVRVTDGPTAGRAAEDAEQLAVHRSAPLSTLVEEMLTHSDNDLAEALGRHAAIAAGERGDFRGLARAVDDGLRALGLPRDGLRVTDGSGLDREGRLTAELLTETLALAAEPDRPELRSALTGLPVAGFTGTLADRYDPDSGTPAGAGAGLVRAKTGTLTGVNTLAGTAITPDGRVLAFAFLANDTVNAFDAQAALDAAAATLASCSCR
ncbi:D-alanyl-D-alanine carboxypeptidase/D-alanyl-D-alanine-endopeptidase [Streptomyces sp. B6B3]|uniref:D-alanyl-D-alanine carboxypeptidase/D-alanyl-D-alanine endopeptidase n=1 Tax=Streptomyces sp. B6B3 TaxID=3153570 RepID=UPI00325E9E4D